MHSDITIDTESRRPDFARAVGGGVFDLGSRLRRARMSANLSQRQLAAKADVSNTTISLIEQNRTSPSVGSLQRILEALPISLAEFFHDKTDPSGKIFFHQSELDSVMSETILSRKIPQGKSNPHMRVAHSFFRPGADTGEQTLPIDDEQSGVIVRGYLEVTVDGTRRTLGPGDAFHFDSRAAYRFRNVEEIECEVVLASTSKTSF